MFFSSCQPEDQTPCAPTMVKNDKNSYPMVYANGEVEQVFIQRKFDRIFMEGDILLAHELKTTGHVSPGKSWPNGVVVYDFAEDFDNQDDVLDAMEVWVEKTGGMISFKERTNESDYVEFFKGDGCWSYIGKQGGKQEISLGSGCYTGQAVHEIGHALGLWHEHTRADRDSFVEIMWCNIDEDSKNNFVKRSSTSDMNGEYDYQSVMHYTEKSFSINGEKTVVSLTDQDVPTKRTAELSDGDLGSALCLYRNEGCSE